MKMESTKIDEQGNIDLNLKCPTILTAGDGRRILVQSWSPTVDMNREVRVTVTGILADTHGVALCRLREIDEA